MSLIYVPLEHLDNRYTKHLDRDISYFFMINNIDYIKIFPDIPSPTNFKSGSFLDSEFTIQFKSAQMQKIAKLYRDDVIKSGDTLFFSDLWFPGIESIAYMNYFAKKDVKITGFMHAGSFTDTDFVRDMERWAKNFEDIIFDITDKIYVGSNFIKNDIIKKRIVDKNKLIVSQLPLDIEEMKKIKIQSIDEYISPLPKISEIKLQKENIVLFCARNCDEKQPHLFEMLEKKLGHKAKFINTQKENLSKKEYYKTLSKSKVIVSFALQENFGYAIQEACYFNVYPVLPNRLVYPEMYPKECLYDTFDQCVELVDKILDNKISIDSTQYIVKDNPLEVWFEDFISRNTR